MAKKYLLFAGKEIDTDKQTVEVNQVIQLEGYSYDKYVVYEIAKNQWGITYKLINLRTKEFGTCDLIRPLSEKFGIGYYYDAENPTFLDAFEVAVLREKAQVNANTEADAEHKEKERKEQVKTIGRERLKDLIPVNAQAVIIACERENESDSQTDYYSASTVRTVILGFSTHTKNNFQEMRGHAGNFEETAYLTEKNEDYEHRENYSGGHGYYLGESKYHGWIIEKEQIYDRERFIERFAYTAGDEANIHIKTTKKTEETTPTEEPITGDYTIVDYSEEAVAIFGDTKAIKQQLSALGGRFNMYLTLNGKKCAGWIFQKSKEDDLRRLVNFN
jgi:hypothetical protein